MLSTAIEMHWIYDIAEMWEGPGKAAQNTFSRTGIAPDMQGSGVTRIDMVYGNFIAKHIVTAFEYRYDLTEGYDDLP